MKVSVHNLRFVDRWQENSLEFGQKSSTRWVVTAEFVLKLHDGKKNTGLFNWLKKESILGDLIETIICSPAYNGNPEQGDNSNPEKRIVVDSYDEKKVSALLQAKIDDISSKYKSDQIAELFAEIKKYFYLPDDNDYFEQFKATKS